MMKILYTLITTICVLLSIAFFTLMERKLISFSQSRKGPNKAAITGILQPITDAIKLFTKENNLSVKSNFTMYLMAPCLNLTCSLAMWNIMPLEFNYSFMKMSILFFLSCMAVNLIALMLMSWASNSNYSFMAMMRTVSQMISYEINLLLILVTLINLSEQMNIKLMAEVQKSMPFVLVTSPMAFMWMLIILAETNRTPFDFSEGESELVSGFNIEYSSSFFMLIFLSEYSSILIMSIATVMMFFTNLMKSASLYILYVMVAWYFIWARTTLPRFRYDKLMVFNWIQILPTTTFILMMSFWFKMYCTMKIKMT